MPAHNPGTDICGDIAISTRFGSVVHNTRSVDSTNSETASIPGTEPTLKKVPEKFEISLQTEKSVDERVCPDGDLVLNLCVKSTLIDCSSPPEPDYRVRLSSVVIRMAAGEFLGKFLRLASDDELVVADKIYCPGDKLSTNCHGVHVAYLPSGELGLSIELGIKDSPQIVERWSNALFTVFSILHCRQHVPDRLSDTTTIIGITELAWALGCLSPVKPWLNLWAHDRQKHGPQPTFIMTALLGLALNDGIAFGVASLNWIWYFSLEKFQAVQDNTTSISPIIFDSLLQKRTGILNALSQILTTMYTEYASPAADEPSRHVKSLAMGLLIRGIHQHILPPTCNSLPLWDPVLLAWGQSLYHLISVFYKLSQDVSQGWCNFFPQKISLDSSPSKSDQLPPPCFKFQCFKTYLAHTKPDDNHKTDPGKCLWQKVKKLCATIEEPKLNDFKPGAVKLLDVPTHLEFKCGCFWSS